MERVTFIKEGFKDIGTQNGVYYTNQEIVDRLKNLQSALAQGVFEKTHAENFTEREVIRHFEVLASDYGLDTSERFIRLKNNLNKMGYTIATYIKGMAGERNAKKALKLISMDKGVKVLYNICLEDEDCQAEYDALVVAPYGLFLVEVKNWFGEVTITSNGMLERGEENKVIYDLSGRMGVKEALLRQCLGDMFPKQYINMLLFSNERVEVKDEYHRVPYFIGGGISGDIRLYSKNGNILSEKQINKICDCILASHCEQKTLCDVNCEEIIDDYAHLMATIEEGVKSGEVTEENNEITPNKVIISVEHIKPKFSLKSVDWVKVGVTTLFGVPLAYLSAKGIKHFMKGVL